MNRLVHVLISSTKNSLLMRRGIDGQVTAFGGAVDSGAPVQAAVRVLREESGLEVRADDLEFLDMYPVVGGTESYVFVLAGVDEDRVHVYGKDESLCEIHRSDDFTERNFTELARKYVIDYFKRHKK